MGVACVRRSRSDDESSKVPDPHVSRWKTRSGRSISSLRDRGIRRWSCCVDTTLSELIRRWLDLVREDLSPSTVLEYERIVRCYIDPDIGRVSLAKLRTISSIGSIRSFATKAARMAGPSRRQRYDRPMLSSKSAQSGDALGLDCIQSGGTSSTPLRVHVALSPPEPDGVLRLIAEAELRDLDLACFLLLAATTGARRGELCAIGWSDLDMNTGALTISRSIVETRGADSSRRTRRLIHPVGLPWIQVHRGPRDTTETVFSGGLYPVGKGLRNQPTCSRRS